MRTSTKKTKKADYKRRKMVKYALSQIETMKKKSAENKESSDVTARKENNMMNFYRQKMGKTFDEVSNTLLSQTN
jgi:hypothetical protein